MKHRTVLLVIDLVNDFTRPDGACYYETTGDMLPRVVEFVNQARERNVYIIWVLQVSETDRPLHTELGSRKKLNCVRGSGGERLDSRFIVDKKRDYLLEKSRADAFFRTELEQLLIDQGIRNVLVCGTKTNCCVRASATGAAMRDYRTYLVSDCVSSNTEEITRIHLEDMSKYFAKAIDSREVLRRLDAGEL